ncbi:MAG: HYR domain-containing protein, partial [Bacteroidetes bacterium]|nr:HYR domain-containing protein [Bacteroidota bacterium]
MVKKLLQITLKVLLVILLISGISNVAYPFFKNFKLIADKDKSYNKTESLEVNQIDKSDRRTIISNSNLKTTLLITCPADITVNNDMGVCGAVVTFTTPTPGAGNTITRIAGLDSGDFFPVGITTVTFEERDDSNNLVSTCSFTVTVTDNIDPTITAPSNVSATTNSGCTATGVVLGTPITSDNCSVASVTHDAPSSFPLGATTVTWTVTDG